ncbi:MAG TPA: ABC transporter [Actinomycetota bacterium]|nr:ABC transporter [Actinomycetota bacterium]
MTSPALAGRRHGGGISGAVASEWVKLWSVRSTWWSLAATALLVAGYVLMVTISATESKANGIEVPPMTPIDVSAGGVFLLGQLGLATLAALSMAGEYATGSILSTLQWVPRRAQLLMGKCLVVAPVLFLAGTAVTILGALAGVPFLETVAGPWSYRELLGSALGVGAYSGVIGIVAVGLAAMLRSVAGTLGCTFLLQLILPMALESTGVEILITASEYFPGSAGMALLGMEDAGYSTATAVAVLIGWAAAAWAGGVAILKSRDAL